MFLVHVPTPVHGFSARASLGHMASCVLFKRYFQIWQTCNVLVAVAVSTQAFSAVVLSGGRAAEEHRRKHKLDTFILACLVWLCMRKVQDRLLRMQILAIGYLMA